MFILLYTVCMCIILPPRAEGLHFSALILVSISQAAASALMLASQEGYTEIVTQLLETGANTDLQTTVNYCICSMCGVL